MPSDRHPTRRSLPAAASTLVAPVVAGRQTAATVLGVHRFALYLSVGASVVPVVTSDAVPLPTAVRLVERSGDVEWGVAAGDVVTVGTRWILLPGADVVVARTWRPARVRRTSAVGSPGGRPSSHLGTRPSPIGWTSSAAEPDGGWLADGIRAACAAVGCSTGRPGSHLSTQLREVGTAVAGLVGRGPGLTPSGDDALAGALLVAHALGTGHTLVDAVRARLGATTAVSAALLDAAADGYAARPVVSLVDAAVAGDPDAVGLALPDVLALGHTSGADTATGIRAALQALHPAGGCSAGCRGDRMSTQPESHDGRSAA